MTWQRFVPAVAALVLLTAGPGRAEPPGERLLVVAANGSGPYRTVQAAVDAVPADGRRVTVRVKPGTYSERIVVPRNKPKLRLIGDDAAATVLTFNLNATSAGPDGRAVGTAGSASTHVLADDFTVENVTFANATPRDVAQAIALSADGDRHVYRRCRFLGWQDTLYLGRGRQLFDDCYVEGGVDFIFGPGTAVFRNCEVHSKRNGYLTAASTPKDVAYGFVFDHCRVTGAADLRVYLGRPWRDHASVVFLNCDLGPHVRPEGWHNWKQPEREKTVRFAEFGSTGPGANTAGRVPWSRRLTAAEAAAITPRTVLAGRDGWAAEAGRERERPE